MRLVGRPVVPEHVALPPQVEVVGRPAHVLAGLQAELLALLQADHPDYVDGGQALQLVVHDALVHPQLGATDVCWGKREFWSGLWINQLIGLLVQSRNFRNHNLTEKNKKLF